ncbi:hypothetical protein F2P45_15300 [Massilia sp. CCM 8733]|uniref:Uncharacterized protein n=1 Tax=Massilia mucilaginosa TaxID=2609282 RepID=A0ABX0NUE3_9BURK|nr:hypothetical protein [Massilia mucilaginosa]NHZ90373.1 hypothetical protein [Massilia mucilaginosa]
MNRRLLEYSPVFDIFTNAAPRPSEQEFDAAPLPDDSADLALAAELLEAAEPADLRRVLGRAIAGAGVLGARVARSPMGPLLVTELLRAVRPILSPQRRPVSGASAKTVSINLGARMFGLELEGLSAEDKEFVLARQLVRLADEAARHAGNAGSATPQSARAAVQAAARQYAPGLLPHVHARPATQGRWTRRAGQLILHDC